MLLAARTAAEVVVERDAIGVEAAEIEICGAEVRRPKVTSIGTQPYGANTPGPSCMLSYSPSGEIEFRIASAPGCRSAAAASSTAMFAGRSPHDRHAAHNH